MKDAIKTLKAIREAAIDDLLATSDEDLMREVAEDNAPHKSVLDECMADGNHQSCYRVRCNLGKRCAAGPEVQDVEG